MISHPELHNWSCLVPDHLFASYNECHCFKGMTDTDTEGARKEQQTRIPIASPVETSKQGFLFRRCVALKVIAAQPPRPAPVPPPTHTYLLRNWKSTFWPQHFNLANCIKNSNAGYTKAWFPALVFCHLPADSPWAPCFTFLRLQFPHLSKKQIKQRTYLYLCLARGHRQ